MNLPATGSPIGVFNFDITNDEQPYQVNGHFLGFTTLTLVAPYSTTYQPSDGLARAVQFDFGPSPQPVASPSARWIRLRYVKTSGGAVGLNVGVSQRGGV